MSKPGYKAPACPGCGKVGANNARGCGECRKHDASLKRMVPGSAEWERAANRLARDYVQIASCWTCGGPRVDGYTCPRSKLHATTEGEAKARERDAKRLP